MKYLSTRRNYDSPVVSAFDSLFNDMLGDWGVYPARFPAVDITENDDAYILEAELPGYKQKEVKVNIEKHVLKLSSVKETKKEEKDKKLLVSERSYQSFERMFSLPDDVDEEKIAGEFADGILTLTLPKKEVAKPKAIEVKIK
ncbi:MAG: heat shock protein Hsp20 [Spirochaeta sp.]|jgi:spore coat protein M/HSP20 family protein|uniref:Hsp20/alpha crystallin family protein n=1 Tax=Sphaerochaeta sp. TaxID=1972642 RepID=UPI003D11BD45|nr:heat shock protein Hsp20 [Spirochaeta sp.]